MQQDNQISDAAAAAAFRRLVTHLQHRHDAQNIDLMGLAGFCRNCLADWVMEADGALTKDEARTLIHGMPAAELYDITRGVWVLSAERASKMKYVFAVYEGVVREVYEPEKWLPAMTTPYPNRTDLVPDDAKGRIEFVGKPAPEAIRQKYLLGDVTAYTKVSLQSPCLYINEP